MGRLRCLLAVLLCVVFSASAQDSLNVRKIGEMFSPDDYAYDLAVSGNYALVANGSYWLTDNRSTLRIVDISSPSHPLLQSTLRMPNYPADLCTAGNYAFIAGSDILGDPGGLVVVDFTDPQSPVPVLNNTLLGSLRAVDVSGNLLFTVGIGGLRILNIADPENPAQAGFFAITGLATCLALSDNRVYVGGSIERLLAIDVSDPAAPFELGSIDTLSNASSIAVSGNLVFVGSGQQPNCRLTVVDFADPGNPLLVGNLSMPDYCNGITLSGNYAYVAAADSGLRIVDISDPALPIEVGVHERDTTDAGEIVIAGNLAYVAYGGDGLRVVDITDPTDPDEVGYCSSPGWCTGVALCDNIAFVASDYSGLTVVDISNPLHPREKTTIRPGNGFDVAVQDDYAYVISDHGRLTVFDISVPFQLSAIGFWSISSATSSIKLMGNFACIACGDSGLVIIDASDPTNPVEAATYTTHGAVYDLAVSGTLAYLACTDGLVILDMVVPTFPMELGIVDSPGAFIHIGMSNGLVCVSRGDEITVVDVSNPVNPVVQGTTDIMTFFIECITLAGHYAYVAAERYGLHVIDLTDPMNPVHSGFYVTPDRAFGVAVRGDTAFVAARSHFGIYDCSAATSVSDHFTPHPSSYTLSVYPNPFNASTRITFAVPHAGQVELKVFDVTGRIAQNLASRTYDVGEHSVLFDGAGLSSGVYFVRLQSAEFAQTQKMVLVK